MIENIQLTALLFFVLSLAWVGVMHRYELKDGAIWAWFAVFMPSLVAVVVTTLLIIWSES